MHSFKISNLYKWLYDCAIHSELYSKIIFLLAFLINTQMFNSMEMSIVLRTSYFGKIIKSVNCNIFPF